MNTVVICPACAGTKTDRTTGIACLWCKGTKTVSAETAKSYEHLERRLRMDAVISGHRTGQRNE